MHIPPQHQITRDRISHRMAFPLGYELLEKAFGDLPQWTECDFWFWFDARPGYWASDFARILEAAEPYAIARVAHPYMSAGFTFSVYPVMRSLKSFAREAFLSSAVDAFRQFITAAPRKSLGFRDAVFDPVAHTCTVQGPKK